MEERRAARITNHLEGAVAQINKTVEQTGLFD